MFEELVLCVEELTQVHNRDANQAHSDNNDTSDTRDGHFQ